MAKRSTTVQLLLDLAHEGGHDIQQMSVADLLDYLQNNSDGRKIAAATDRKFNTHRYPMDSITFTRISTLDKVPGVTRLSDHAAKTLLLLCQSMSQSCCVRGTVRSLSDAFGMSRNMLHSALKELAGMGYITHIKQGAGRGAVSVYMINPQIAKQGTNNHALQARFDTLCPPSRQQIDLPNSEVIDIGREHIVTSKIIPQTVSAEGTVQLDTTQDKLYASTVVKRTAVLDQSGTTKQRRSHYDE